jgi:hypothetical protein
MEVPSANELTQGLGALRAGVEALSSAWRLIKDIRASGKPTEEQSQLIDRAISEAGKAAKIAEVQMAQSLGFKLCKCEFPPNIMLSVGYRIVPGFSEPEHVFECKSCGLNTAAPFAFNRTKPASA